MELLKLSKFKLQLQSLTSEFRDLTERERSASEQLRTLNERQKQTEEEYGKRLQELLAELALSNETCQKLERKVSYLQSDNALLERKQRELKETIQGLLQCREQFVNAYEESTCDMKRAIESSERKLNYLSEKISSHISLFDSIEKEASSVKQLVDSVQLHVSERENIVASLKSKLEKVSAFEEVFFEKIHCLESKLKYYEEEEFPRQNKVILQLEGKLEAAKISDDSRYQIEVLQRTLLTKDTIIQNLISEKEAFHVEVGSLRIILQRIQETVTSMNEEDKRVFSSLVDQQEGSNTNKAVNDNSRMVCNSQDSSPYEACGKHDAEHTASPRCKKVCKELQENNINSLAPEFAVLQSACFEPHSEANDSSLTVKDNKENCTASVHLLDSECSATNAENSQPS